MGVRHNNFAHRVKQVEVQVKDKTVPNKTTVMLSCVWYSVIFSAPFFHAENFTV